MELSTANLIENSSPVPMRYYTLVQMLETPFDLTPASSAPLPGELSAGRLTERSSPVLMYSISNGWQYNHPVGAAMRRPPYRALNLYSITVSFPLSVKTKRKRSLKE